MVSGTRKLIQSGVVAALAWSSSAGLLRTGVVKMLLAGGGIWALSVVDNLVKAWTDGLRSASSTCLRWLSCRMKGCISLGIGIDFIRDNASYESSCCRARYIVCSAVLMLTNSLLIQS